MVERNTNKILKKWNAWDKTQMDEGAKRTREYDDSLAPTNEDGTFHLLKYFLSSAMSSFNVLVG